MIKRLFEVIHEMKCLRLYIFLDIVDGIVADAERLSGVVREVADMPFLAVRSESEQSVGFCSEPHIAAAVFKKTIYVAAERPCHR